MKGQLRLAIAVLAVAMRPASVAISASAFKGSFERTLKVNGPVDLDVTTGSGDIVVRTGDTATVRVKGTIQVQSDRGGTVGKAEERVRYLESHPPIRQDGNRIRVGPIEDRELSRNVSIDYELVVPAETRLSSQTGSGDQSIEGLRGRVNAKSGSGDIKLDSVQGSIQIDTGSGDVSLQQTRAGGITVETGSGDVTLRLPSKGGFDLSARTSSGDISIDPLLAVEGRIAHNEARGKVRGGGYAVDVRTGSGDIRID